MRLDPLFRLFNHASLALSCACLLQSETHFIPSPELAIVPVMAIVLLAARLEGRWGMTDGAANLFAILIAMSGVWWMLLQVYGPAGQMLPLPTGLVPHLGPMVMALLLVKLFRPRRPADFWVLQGMGLLQVALACVLAADPRFGLYFAGYVACGLVCLVLHHATQVMALSSAGRTAPSSATPAQVPAGPFLRRPLLWLPAVAATALVIFLITPRGNWPTWEPLMRFGFADNGVRAQAGFSEEINLNRTGELELDDEVAFQVTVSTAQGTPKTDLSPVQRWRGTVLDAYREGRWFAMPERGIPSGRDFFRDPHRARQEQLPDLGPAQYFLAFQVKPRRAGGLFLAEPIHFGRGDTVLPVIAPDSPSPAPFVETVSTVLPISTGMRREVHYLQVTTPTAVPGRIKVRMPHREYVHLLLAQPPETVRIWTHELLQRLADEHRYGLIAADANLGRLQKNDTGEPIPRSAARVARALRSYLAESGDFSYSLDLRRQDEEVDPATDFLCNVREGHCERFASGLALMLRGCGIPARVVKGFRGSEQQADGVYVVRQRDAHSWVEAIVPQTGPENEVLSCDWLTLDPTPAADLVPKQSFSLVHWWRQQWRHGEQLWQELVLRLNSEQQADLWHSFSSPRGAGRTLLRILAAPVAIVFLAWMAWRFVPRFRNIWVRRKISAPNNSRPPWLLRLFEILARHLGVQPQPGQTPRETSVAAGAALRGRSDTAALADLPGRVVEMYYRFRFGARPPSDDERRAIEEDLARLEAALLR